MDVTRKNFKESLPLVASSIKEASFIAIDGEFTGLSVPGQAIHALDLPEERYDKVRQSVNELLLVQFGMCTFAWDEEQSKYTTRAFNFYIFPKPFNRQASDRRFTCQSSSIDFLATQGFDFNKTFREGIPYLLPAEEEKLRVQLDEKYARIEEDQAATSFSSPNPAQSPAPPAVPDEHRELIESICDKITSFLKTEEKELALPALNGYLRKLIYQTTKSRFPKEVVIDTRTNEKKLRYQVVTRITSEEELRKREAEKKQKEYDQLDDAVGFTKVVQLLSQSGAVVVGHNMLMDLLYTLSQFLCTLPQDYEEFKMLVSATFPRLIDTKHISSSELFKDLIPSTMLADLHRCMEEEPFTQHRPAVQSAEGFPNYSTEQEKLHEAGYDAYITGLSYATLRGFCRGNVDRFLNKLHLMRIYDIPYMNLSGKDLPPLRDHVMHVRLPSIWRHSDLQQLFSPFGPISVSWIDSSSAFVSLHMREAAAAVLKQLKSTHLYQVQSYKQFRQQRAESQHAAVNNVTCHKHSTNQISAHKRKHSVSEAESCPPPKRHIINLDVEKQNEAAGDTKDDVTDDDDDDDDMSESDDVTQDEDDVTEEDDGTEMAVDGVVAKKANQEEDLGVPVAGVKRSSAPPASKSKENDFEVPDTW